VSDTIFLTGGTGFLGMAQIARWLDADEGPEIRLAVRARDAAEADERLTRVLAGLYDDPPASASRLRAVCADLQSPGLGLSESDRRSIAADVDRVVHCAASVEFTLPLEEARAINLEGTRRVLELAAEIDGLERLVHVSTAYVCGDVSGRFAEDEDGAGEGFRNTYEQTKWEAERAIAEAEHLPAVVVRPSIIVGESDSGWTSSFNVIYWPLQAFARGLFDEVPAHPEGVIDMVPVDHVAAVIDRATFDREANGTYHAVAGERAMSVAELIEQTTRTLDRPAPRFTEPDAVAGDHPAAAYAAYFNVRMRFGDERARGLVADGSRVPEGSEYLPKLLGYAQKAGWGKRSPSRQQARADASDEAAGELAL
jgi:long-chain acyl-CoA synthetase